MQDGMIVFDGTAKELTDKAAREIYGAEAEEAFSESMTSTSLRPGAAAQPQPEVRVVN